jgi:glycine/D-amino acid oxidase-like deaminating enzyme
LQCTGRLHPAGDSKDAEAQSKLVSALGGASSQLSVLNLEQTRHHWPHPPGLSLGEHGALWMPEAVTLQVQGLRDHVLRLSALPDSLLQLQLGRAFQSEGWKGDHRILILACGVHAAKFLDTPGQHRLSEMDATLGPLASWSSVHGASFTVTSRGETSQSKPSSSSFKARSSIGGAINLHHLEDQRWLIGSSFLKFKQEHPAAIGSDDDVHWRAITDRLGRLPSAQIEQLMPLARHEGSRAYVDDRMPMIGPLDQRKPAQRYLAGAFGSRGLLWAHLAATLIADHIDGKFPPIGMKALKSVDPYRFIERRKNSTQP